MTSKPYKVINNYVFVVLEHHTKTSDAKIHGIYSDFASAEGSKAKAEGVKNHGYVSILKKPVRGRERKLVPLTTSIKIPPSWLDKIKEAFK